MSDKFELKFTPEVLQNLQLELIIDIYSKISSLQAFIIEQLADKKPDKYNTKELAEWFTENINANKLNLIAEITRKHSI